MDSTSAVAAGVLASCLGITLLLSKAKVVGMLAVTGFVLGVLAAVAAFVLVG
jgi:hypothetical protein